jgi:hypothetical protein
MSNRWYYRIFGEEFGPVTESQLLQLLDDGTLSNTDSVRREGFDEWFELCDAFPALDEAAGEIADLSELAFSFEESGPTTRRTAYGAESQLAAGGAGTGGPHRTLTEHVLASDEPIEVYFYQTCGETFGPISLAELNGMAEAGSLCESDLVRTRDGAWTPASDIRELAATLLLSDRNITTTPDTTTAAVSRLSLPQAERIESDSEVTADDSRNASAQSEPSSNAVSAGAPSATSRAERPVRKNGKKKSRKADDAILNEIFDEVFAEEEKPVRAAGSPRAAAGLAVPSQDEPAELSVNSPVMNSAPQQPAGTSTAAGALAAKALASSRAAIPAKSLATKKSSMSFDFAPGKGVIIVFVLLVAVAGYVYQFGLPSLSSFTASQEDYPDLVKAAIAEYKAMGDPSERDWRIYSARVHEEFFTYYKNMVASGVSDPKSKACMRAMKQLVELSAVSFSEKAIRETTFAEAEKLALELDK